MPERPETETETSAKPETSRAVVRPWVRRIVVSADDIFQNEAREFRRVTLEGVILRYVLVSAAIIGILILLGLIWWVFSR